jgi:hypothetical protein
VSYAAGAVVELASSYEYNIEDAVIISRRAQLTHNDLKLTFGEQYGEKSIASGISPEELHPEE